MPRCVFYHQTIAQSSELLQQLLQTTSSTTSSTISSTKPSTMLKQAGEMLSARPFSGVSQPRPSPLRSLSTTAIAPRTYQPICSRLNVTTSVLTLSRSSQSTPTRSTPKAVTLTSTGLVVVETSPPRNITLNRVIHLCQTLTSRFLCLKYSIGFGG